MRVVRRGRAAYVKSFRSKFDRDLQKVSALTKTSVEASPIADRTF
jgi:hypothetical protein